VSGLAQGGFAVRAPLTAREARALPEQHRGAKSLPNAHQEICFTKVRIFRQPLPVSNSLRVCLLLSIVLPCVHAQDQESKLVDRLLRPDTTLKNKAQNKQFIADGASINKKATVGAFYVEKKSNSKPFAGIRAFWARRFHSQSFHDTRSAPEISTQQAIGNSHTSYPTRTVRGQRDAPQSTKKVASRSYAENKPFLDQGKSQKSLNRQNAPLTIDQVRELLNKNK
jgi:hypothetical protein